jgi:hypothetical protein
MRETAVDDQILNDFAKVFAAALFSQYPEWRNHAEINGSSRDCLVVTVPAPAAAHIDSPLRIYTDDEVTIEFDGFHMHFDWPPVSPRANWSFDALSVVDAILSEIVGVVSWWEGVRQSVSATFRPGEPDGLRAPPGTTRVRKRSWQGTLNADAKIEWLAIDPKRTRS